MLAADGAPEVVVVETGPESRPFPALKGLALDAIAEEVLAVLRGGETSD